MSTDEKHISDGTIQVPLGTGDRELVVSQILETIGAEALKQEALIQLRSQKGRLDELLRHPFLLLGFGFLLTSIGGAVISASYQSREWTRQQKVLSKQRRLEDMKKIEGDTTRAIAEMLSAADDASALYYWGNVDSGVSKDENDRIHRWEVASLKWRSDAFTLLPQAGIYFRNDEISKILKQIDDHQQIMGNGLKSFFTLYSANKKATLKAEDTKAELQDCLNKTNEAREMLGRLTNLMIAEIHSESELTERY